MKLIVDIAEDIVTKIKDNAMFAETIASQIKWGITSAIVNAKPLDKIKKEIDEQSAMHMDGDFYIRNFDVKWILDGNEVSE